MSNTFLKPEWSKRDYERNLFKEALRRTTPEVLKSLYDDVLPTYTTLTPDIAKRSYSSRKLRPLNEGNDSEIDPASVEQAGDFPLTWRKIEAGGANERVAARLKEALQKWQSSFRLNADWILDAAVQTLFLWSQSAPQSSDLKWGRVPSLSMALEERKLKFVDPGWQVENETWREFEDRVTQGFKKRLRTYKVAITKRALTLGWTEEPIFKEKSHFDWLALYQVRHASPKDIAAYFQLERKQAGNIQNTVFQGVRRKAKLIALTLR